jgi:hypothetical protein
MAGDEDELAQARPREDEGLLDLAPLIGRCAAMKRLVN